MKFKKKLMTFLIIVFTLLSFSAYSVSKNVTTNNTRVKISSGEVEGVLDKGIFIYKGIPYATAERFMPPEKIKKFDGVFKADKLGDICPQVGSFPINSGPELTQSESCLNLNVWTPSINENKKLPVMVWFHGGGMVAGSSMESYNYDGENLSRKGDIVVVSVNHRLNLLGFLDLSAYGEKYKYSANVGIMDLVASLEWVKENIEKFGGDPNNVTIFGESGGGAKVLTLMATPSAKGLFHKAIVESGAVERTDGTSSGRLTAPKASKRVAELTLQYLNIKPNEVDKLKEIPYEKLKEVTDKALSVTAKEQNIKAIRGNGLGLAWGPTLDGNYIPTEPVGNKFSEQSKNIPLLIGSNLTEWETIPLYSDKNSENSNKNTWNNEEIEKYLKNRFGDNADKIAELFKKAYPNKKVADAIYC